MRQQVSFLTFLTLFFLDLLLKFVIAKKYQTWVFYADRIVL